MALGAGQGSNLTLRHHGDQGGNEGVTLTQLNMPSHNHTVKCDTNSPPPTQKNTPVNDLFGLKSRERTMRPVGPLYLR